MLGPPLAAAAITAVLCAVVPAYAQEESPKGERQETPTRSDSGVEEIVVKGTLQGATDFAASDSVTAFNASELQALGAQTIEDIAAFTPNLEIVSSGATTPTFFIRGVGLNDFNANATSSVAVYQDDVNLNAQGLQLPTIFDVDTVEVLRGPQGTGLARNSSAGAIKLYSRKPSGQYNGFFIGSAGNYDFLDFQGGVEAPLWQDILSARLAFRWSDRDGFVKNGCGGLPFARNGVSNPYIGVPMGICHTRLTTFPENLFSGLDIDVPAGLPKRANDLHNWAGRATFRFEPGLDSSWLAGVQYSKRHERSRLGQAYGTLGLQFGTFDILNYTKPEVARMEADVFRSLAAQCNCDISTRFNQNKLKPIALAINAPDLAKNLDDDPWTGYYDRVGPTTNEIISSYIRGEIYLPYNIEMKSVSGFASYKRLIDVDIDFSPTVLAEIVAPDDLYQLTQDVSFEGDFGDLDPATWGLGGYFLYEDLNVEQDITLRQDTAPFLISGRTYTQQIRSFGVYGEFSRDLWNDFTLDGGARWNWEAKELRMKVLVGRGVGPERETRRAFYFNPDDTWQAPTGTVRLSYRLQEDSRLYWKYTRGWKSGHYNAAAPPRENKVSTAKPEQIDSFETGLTGSWFNGRLTADASLFYYMYDNYQLFTIQADFGTLPAFVVLTVPHAEVYGGELDLVARPWAGAFLEARGSWLESHFVDFVTQQIQRKQVGNRAVTFIREVDSTGYRMLNSPQFKVSVTAEQAIPLGKYLTVIPRYDMVWTSENYFDSTQGRGIPSADGPFLVPPHTFSQVAYFLHNVRVSLVPPAQNPVISLWVHNVENRAYRQLGADANIFLGTTLHFIGDPRTYGADVMFTF
jgi:iron complex outermembrane receptor protein